MEGNALYQKNVLITGGTGTIGSEIVRQVLPAQPRVVRVLSRDETKQANLRLNLPREAPVRFLVGDVRDPDRLRCALEGVDVVFHVAALKQVPSCEYNPFEAVQTNVIGTQNLIQACRDAGVGQLTYVSTDKAVNPVNTMGATKLLAENLVRSSQDWNASMVLSVVRFGNVLGSRGSLLPLLARQMEERGAVDITSSEMTRFMMTVPQAVQLVLQASEGGRGGELFILKMPALRVVDLIEVFVEEYCELRGWDPGAIERNLIGARAGEKHHEELVTREESLRLEERDSMFVVHPLSCAPAFEAPIGIPDSCDSARSRHASRSEIRELIHASGFLEQVRVPLIRSTVLA